MQTRSSNMERDNIFKYWAYIRVNRVALFGNPAIRFFLSRNSISEKRQAFASKIAHSDSRDRQ